MKLFGWRHKTLIKNIVLLVMFRYSLSSNVRWSQKGKQSVSQPQGRRELSSGKVLPTNILGSCFSFGVSTS